MSGTTSSPATATLSTSTTSTSTVSDNQVKAPEESAVENDVEDEELLDEEQGSEEGEERRSKSGSVNRTVTLQMLLETNILQPGEANMSIEYLGQRFIGDLLNDGKIKSLETDIIFASPSAWASHCKRIINPDKKSGCGWASVKYQGQKLDFFKNRYFKMKALEAEGKEQEAEKLTMTVEEEEVEVKPPPPPAVRVPVKHGLLGNRTAIHDMNTLVETTAFSSVGKIQPFLVSLSTNAALVIDFHCHLTSSEVVGYLAGQWDVNLHNLSITHAFPCRSRLHDKELGPLVEEDIYRAIESRKLTLVGWYHAHPHAPPTPSLRDIDSQLDYELKMKGNSDASYIPCIGLICSPYYLDSMSFESAMQCYWVLPPPENKPMEYGKPFSMTYSMVQDQFLSQDAVNEMKKCSEFYKGDKDYVQFTDKYRDNVTMLDKMKISLNGKLPREHGDLVWPYLCELIHPTGKTVPSPVVPEGVSHASTSTAPANPPPAGTITPISIPITIPSANKPLFSATDLSSTSKPLFPTSSGADIASALFAAAGKFPLMGLSFPSSHLTPPSTSMFKPLTTPTPAKVAKTDESVIQPPPVMPTVSSS